jgi:hypothetical protein
MGRGSDKVWPQELLTKSNLGGMEPRIFLIRYDSRRLEREHFIYNLPDHEIDSLTESLA